MIYGNKTVTIMTDEQIKQNAESIVQELSVSDKVVMYSRSNMITAAIQGAHSRDGEIENLQIDMYGLQGSVDLWKGEAGKANSKIRKLEKELDKLRNPWISVDERLPDQKIGLCLTLIYDLDTLTMKHYKKPRVSLNVYKGNNTWNKGTKTEVRYWMPIPELKKGE